MVIIGDVRRSTKKFYIKEVNFEWKIPDFLQLSSGCYESPKFYFCSEAWEIRIYPKGNGHVGYISIYIAPMSLNVPISVDYSLHFQTVDGKADTEAKFTTTRIFDNATFSNGVHRFMSRSNLIEKQSELLPSGVLTVICTLKKTGTNDGDGYAIEIIDEFTQTEEGTGIYKLQQHFKEILENENVSDVVLKVDGQEFKSHRCVLAARSPVFLAMMTHDTKEKNTGVVDVQDIDPDAFPDFLRYLYTGNCEIITQKNVVKLYTAADKYQVDELKKNCLDYMMIKISVDNFCDLLRLSLEHVEKDLTDVCSQFFMENAVAIISTPMWITFLRDNLVAGNELYLKHLKNIMTDKNSM